MDKALKIAVVLSAYDKMSRVVNDAVNKSTAKLQSLKNQSMDLFGKGSAMLAAGAGVTASLLPAVQAYADLEDSALRLRSVMMKPGGRVPEEFEKVNALAIELGNLLPGTTSDFQNMFAAMIRGGVDASNILSGTGKAAAFLAVQLKLPYEEAATGAAKLKEATGVADTDMMKFMDTISRLDNVGVKFDEMQYAFSRSAGQLKFLKIQGLEATNQMAALYAMLVKGGASGETVGTGMSTAFSNLFNKKKMDEANAAAKKLGFQFDFIDKKGNFKGVENFVKQLDKLKGMSEQQISDVLAPLFGATGQDSQFIKSIAQGGMAAYVEMQKRMRDQASLQEKVTSQLSGLKQLWEATTGTFTNFMASFGEAIGPELKMVAEYLGKISAGLQEWTSQHPKLAKFIGLFIAGTGIFMMLVGVVLMVKAAFVALNVVMLANPIVLVVYAVIALIAAVAALVIYWEDLVKWVKESSIWMKILLSPIIGVYMGVIAIAYAARTIIDNWEPIVGFFSNLWDRIGEIFKVAVVKLIDLAVAPVRALEYSMNKIKEFSGIGTQTNIAGQASANLQEMLGVGPSAPSPAPSPVPNSGGGPVLNYQPNVSINGGASPADKESMKKMLDQHGEDLMRKMEIMNQRKDARKFN